MEKNAQISLLAYEKQRIGFAANDLREAVATVEDHDVPTAGVVCNLKAVIDAWETEQVKQIDHQLAQLEVCV